MIQLPPVPPSPDRWQPVAAANQLMLLVQEGLAAKRGYVSGTPVTEVSERRFTKALAPIKSFMTRRGNAAGMVMPTINFDGTEGPDTQGRKSYQVRS